MIMYDINRMTGTVFMRLLSLIEKTNFDAIIFEFFFFFRLNLFILTQVLFLKSII